MKKTQSFTLAKKNAMKRISLLFVLFLLSTSLFAQDKFSEGQHYEVVSEKASEEPMVTEFFSLFCGHCFQFEPVIDSLRSVLPESATFKRSHVDYLPSDNEKVGYGIVKAYVLMNELDMEEELRRAFFLAIHISGEEIDSEEKIKEKFVEAGVDAAQFDELYSSKSVEERAQAMAALYLEREVKSVPSVIVNDKFKVNMGSITSIQQFNELINWLLTKK